MMKFFQIYYFTLTAEIKLKKLKNLKKNLKRFIHQKSLEHCPTHLPMGKKK